MLNKVVIVSDGTKTLVHINGKTYGNIDVCIVISVLNSI